MSGKVHIGVEYENYRFYFDDEENIKCKCGVFCLIANPHSRTVGEVCKKCNSIYKHPKLWTLKCSVCTPRNSSSILSKVHIGKDFTFVKGGK
tara:strand:- start:519 stop:794 length:276 start_codon:yes stop_codon:yes gene_type:complete